jgi:hypothetical protein
MSVSYRHGALHVIEQAPERDEIQRALKQLDERLFLERQLTLAGEEVWCVCVTVAGDRPPLTILEWRDPETSEPLALSHGIVNRMARMERDGGKLSASVLEQNAARIEGRRQLTQEQWSEISADAERLMHPAYSAVLPRGYHLRRSRDRKRNQGWRV